MRLKDYLAIGCAAFVLYAMCFVAVQSVSAQVLSVSVSPPLVETTIQPGKSILVAYTVSNLGDPAIISADVRPFTPTGILGGIQLKENFEGPIRFSLDNTNIALGKAFLLQSRKGQQLLLRIRVPEGTPEGDYYYTFYAQNELGKPLEGTNTAASQVRVGANILVTVTQSGNVDIQGSIGQLTVKPHYTFNLFGTTINLFESTDTIPVDLIIQNTGRNYVKPAGEISLKGTFGDRGRFPLLPQNVLAQSSRLVQASASAQVDHQDAAGHSLTLTGFFVGVYTVAASVNFGPGTPLQTATTTFYALPFKLIFASGIALIAGIVIIQQLRKTKQD